MNWSSKNETNYPDYLSVLAVSTGVSAQTAAEITERALAAAPRQMRDGATVIKWNADNTYETLKKGTNRLLCYDRSGEPGRQPFAVQCTSIANLERVAQNRKFEAMSDMAARQAALDAAEANGSRVKPEYGSVWYDMNGPDQAHARMHVTIAVPGATSTSTGLPDNPKQGGVWIILKTAVDLAPKDPPPSAASACENGSCHPFG